MPELSDELNFHLRKVMKRIDNMAKVSVQHFIDTPFHKHPPCSKNIASLKHHPQADSYKMCLIPATSYSSLLS